MILFLSESCNSDKEDAITKIEPGTGKITFYFDHKINNQKLITDTLVYSNEAGNQYLISEIQYFISDITLYKSDSKTKTINEWEDIHYVDTDISESQIWNVYDEIESGDYDSISFTFGINQAKNNSFMYVNPPERDMFWPEYLGGGYHYMKLNGKWKNSEEIILPFDFHLGIGQIYAGDEINVDSIIAFEHNFFKVILPNSEFRLNQNETKNIRIIMNIENWFKEPHTYDHNYWGGYIMQNQEAMKIIKENGANVFSVEIE